MQSPIVDYTAVFEELPVPATVIDTRGIILDVNQAFLQYARRRGREIRKADRIGAPITAFVETEEQRSHWEAFIREVLTAPGIQHVTRWKTEDATGRPVYANVTAAAIHDQTGHVVGAVILREEITERVREEQRREVVARVREAIWQMRESEDIRRVLSIAREGLQALGIPFTDCGVNTVDSATDPPRVWSHNMTQEDRWLQLTTVPGAAAIVQIWRGREVVYRPDLELKDHYGEAGYVATVFGHRVRAVVDVPFSHGTLALNSTQPHAFSTEEIDVLRELAQVLTEGFRRLADLRALEQRTQEVEARYQELRRTERSLQEQRQRLHLLETLDAAFVGTTDLPTIYRRLYELLPQYPGVHRVSLLLYDEARHALISDQLIGVDRQDEQLVSAPQPIGYSISGRCFTEARPIVVQDCSQTDLIPREFVEALRLKSTAAVPILFRERVLGVLRVDNTERPDSFTEEDVAFFSMVAEQLGAILESGRLLTTLQKREDHLRLLTEQLPALLWTTDTELRITFGVGKGWAELRLGPGHLSGESLLEHCHTDDPTFPLIAAHRQALQGEVVAYEMIWAERTFHTYVEPLRAPDGTIVGCVGVALDITERKLLEAQLRQAQKMEAVGQLAGGIAHDFNNLLTVILGSATFALMTLPPEHPTCDDLDQIKQAAERAANLTRQLLAFARRQLIHPRVLSLDALLFDLDRMLRRLIGEDIELIILPNAESGWVKIDPGQVEQVLVNLVVNARDAMPTGGKLVIETANATIDQTFAEQHLGAMSGPYVRLTIRDTGCGMTEEVKAHLFEPFFTTKEVGKGTGLGLATIYGIVKQNGGGIRIESAVDQGTTVQIYLPRVEKTEAEMKLSEESLAQGTETILLVEDDPALLRMAVRTLRAQGYTVLETTNGEEALRVAQAHGVASLHLLVTDVVMPQMGGREVVWRLRAVHPGLRVLMMSGYTDETLIRYDLASLGVAFLEKPFTPERFARKVREVLDAPRKG